jgi:hypothetical protein
VPRRTQPLKRALLDEIIQACNQRGHSELGLRLIEGLGHFCQ